MHKVGRLLQQVRTGRRRRRLDLDLGVGHGCGDGYWDGPDWALLASSPSQIWEVGGWVWGQLRVCVCQAVPAGRRRCRLGLDLGAGVGLKADSGAGVGMMEAGRR
eukprot:366243-Chlamydomonas_euryale.AAC.13